MCIYNFECLQESWYKAKYYCKSIGMELVSIETEDEQRAIIKYLSKFHLLLNLSESPWKRIHCYISS
jgi:hypothetical protein